VNATTAIIVALAAVGVLGALAAFTLARRTDVRGAGALSAETIRRDHEAHERRRSSHPRQTAREVGAAGAVSHRGEITTSADEWAPVPWSAPDPDALGTSRRHFLNRATVSLMGAGIGAFGAASFVGFLWPNVTGGFGGRVAVGRFDDVIGGIRAGGGFLYSSEAKTWITEYPSASVADAAEVYDPALMPGISAGLIASYQKCPHLGCRVPECLSSQWFECPCHGSRYSRVGEHKGGPAPRGLDHFPLDVSPAGDVTIDTGTIILGAPLGTNTTGQEAEGPSCIAEGSH
jgi:cytochrome b6-f complex iron-sulfur subunit